MEETLQEFTGTLLIISHDIYFLNHLCDKLLVIEDETIKRLEVGFEEYNQKGTESPTEGEVKQAEELLIIETEISDVLGELSLLTPDQDRYKQLDQQFLELTKRKRLIMNNK